MKTFKPEVDVAKEFLEISGDFGDPKELIREAISNSFDANATEIAISTIIDKSSGEDELVIKISDNGEGMDEKEIKYFFGLGRTSRIELDSKGKDISESIGKKGHGTKIYYNSTKIEVETIKNGSLIRAFVDMPKKNLRLGNIPKVKYEVTDTNEKNGTKINVRGYSDNITSEFDHEILKDYIYWFTKFGSFEMELGIKKYEKVSIKLLGLGWEKEESENLKFGHRFAEVNTDTKKLGEKDKVSPLDYYVAKWFFPKEKVIDMPDAKKIDFIFYIEGDKAKREINPMLKKGQYTVTERYGLWLCKDYIPIKRENTWVAEKSEWTKYHAFVNSQDFCLTANRNDLGNTPKPLLNNVEKTVRKIFEEEIKDTEEFKKYEEELEKEGRYKDAKREEKDFKRRKKNTLKRKVAEFKNITLLEPFRESGVYTILIQLLTIKPNLFGFKIIDYDTSSGYDLLVTKDYPIDLEKAAIQFVEIKKSLNRRFDHSFGKLAAVICWDTKLVNNDEVEDLIGRKRIMKITPMNKENNSYTKYMLTSNTEPFNIEVFVLKEFFREHKDLKIEFKKRSE